MPNNETDIKTGFKYVVSLMSDSIASQDIKDFESKLSDIVDNVSETIVGSSNDQYKESLKALVRAEFDNEGFKQQDDLSHSENPGQEVPEPVETASGHKIKISEAQRIAVSKQILRDINLNRVLIAHINVEEGYQYLKRSGARDSYRVVKYASDLDQLKNAVNNIDNILKEVGVMLTDGQIATIQKELDRVDIDHYNNVAWMN